MAVIRRHWLMSLTVVLVLAGGAGWLAFSHFSQAKADPPATPESPTAPAGGGEPAANAVDPDTYCRVRELRERLCLRNEDLAAMGCTQAQAESVLEGLVNWYKANKAAWSAARKTQGDARKALRHGFAKMHMGPRDATLLASMPALKKAVADAATAEGNAVGAAIPTVEALVSAEQKTLWSVARANAAAPSQYRYTPGLTAAQLKTLHVARRTRARQLAGARTAAVRTTAETALRTSETNTLTAAQRTTMAAAKTNLRAKMPGVLAAAEKILPYPEEMKMPDGVLPPEPTAPPGAP